MYWCLEPNFISKKLPWVPIRHGYAPGAYKTSPAPMQVFYWLESQRWRFSTSVPLKSTYPNPDPRKQGLARLEYRSGPSTLPNDPKGPLVTSSSLSVHCFNEYCQWSPHCWTRYGGLATRRGANHYELAYSSKTMIILVRKTDRKYEIMFLKQ